MGRRQRKNKRLKFQDLKTFLQFLTVIEKIWKLQELQVWARHLGLGFVVQFQNCLPSRKNHYQQKLRKNRLQTKREKVRKNRQIKEKIKKNVERTDSNTKIVLRKKLKKNQANLTKRLYRRFTVLYIQIQMSLRTLQSQKIV